MLSQLNDSQTWGLGQLGQAVGATDSHDEHLSIIEGLFNREFLKERQIISCCLDDSKLIPLKQELWWVHITAAVILAKDVTQLKQSVWGNPVRRERWARNQGDKGPGPWWELGGWSGSLCQAGT